MFRNHQWEKSRYLSFWFYLINKITCSCIFFPKVMYLSSCLRLKILMMLHFKHIWEVPTLRTMCENSGYCIYGNSFLLCCFFNDFMLLLNYWPTTKNSYYFDGQDTMTKHLELNIRSCNRNISLLNKKFYHYTVNFLFKDRRLVLVFINFLKYIWKSFVLPLWGNKKYL